MGDYVETNGQGERSNQSMEVARRKRGVSPAPRRGSMGSVFVGDASTAAVAGTVEAQEKQEPYKRSVLSVLKEHYPRSTHLGHPKSKYGGFTVTVHVYDDNSELRKAEDAVKKQFPHSNVVRGDGKGVYEWFFTYVDPVEVLPWGSILCDVLLILIVILVGIFIINSKGWLGN